MRFPSLTLKDIFEMLLSAFIFVIPFSFRSIVYQVPAKGITGFNPYTTFFLYASDILLVALVLVFALAVLKKVFPVYKPHSKEQQLIWAGLLLFFLLHNVSAFFAEDSILIFLRSIRLFFLYFFLYMVAYYFSINRALYLFIVSMCFQSVIALLQYVLQGSIGLAFLGEPVFNTFTLGTAKVVLGDHTFIRSYGTTLHPNILSGLLFVALSAAYYFYTRQKTLVWLLVLPLLLLGLITTFSRMTMIAVVISSLIWVLFRWNKISRKTIVVSLSITLAVLFSFFLVSDADQLIYSRFLTIFQDASFTERIASIKTSLSMIIAHPFGVGAHQSTIHLQEFASVKILPWEFQPVHAVPLLLAVEMGFYVPIAITGLIWYILSHLRQIPQKFLLRYKQKMGSLSEWLIIGTCIISLGDHYFFTNYSAMLVVMLIMAVIFHGVDFDAPLKRPIYTSS